MEKRVFDRLCGIVYDNCGIYLSEGKSALVATRVGKRMRSLNLATHKDYLKYLEGEGGSAEMIQFLDVISTNTTFFFREPAHFEFLADYLRKWKIAGQKRFRIWCAASSSGEEPYSIAMVCRDVLGGDGYDVKILATDISTQILEKAARGEYEAQKVEKVPRHLLSRGFTKATNSLGQPVYTVNSELKSMIAFRRLNLAKPPFPMRGPLDLVMCRNVMIYFDNTVRKRLVDDITRLLKPGGYLVVGHSESLTSISPALAMESPSIYRK